MKSFKNIFIMSIICLNILLLYSLTANAQNSTNYYLAKSKYNLYVSQKTAITVYYKGNNGKEIKYKDKVTYRSTNNKIITVSKAGSVKALKSGKAKVIVKIPNYSKELTCNIVVKKKSNAEKSFNNLMSATKKLNFKSMDKYISSWGKYKTDSISKEFKAAPMLKKNLLSYSKKLNYSITKIKASKKRVDMYAAVEYHDTYDYCNKYKYSMFKSVLSGEAHNNNSKSEQTKLLNKWHKYAKKHSSDGTINKNIKFTFIKKNNKWKLKQVDNTFYNMMLSNYPKRTKQALNDNLV